MPAGWRAPSYRVSGAAANRQPPGRRRRRGEGRVPSLARTADLAGSRERVQPKARLRGFPLASCRRGAAGPAAQIGGPLQSRTVAGERIKLVVSERTTLGSAESRRLRRQGLIPGVVYGRSEPFAISVGERELRAALTSPAGSHAVLDVAIDGGRSHSVILKDFQRDKIRGQIIHIDLQEVRLDQPIQTTVSVTLVGEPTGVKEGGILTQVANEVNVEALPLDVPQHLEADISGLGIGDSLRLGDVAIPEGVTLVDDPESILATVSHQTREDEPSAESSEAGSAGEEAEESEAGGEPASEG